MKTIYIKAIVEKDGDSYYAYCPSLKGLHVGGDTQDEVVDNVKDAILVYIQSMINHDEILPNDADNRSNHNAIMPSFCVDEQYHMVYAQ